MTGPGTYWRTLQHLKPEQVVGRLRFKLQRPRPDLRPAPPRRHWAGPWVLPARREPSLVGPTRFRLLQAEHELADIGWDAPRIELLWRYNQHYFDDLNAQDAAQRGAWHRALLQRWIVGNPPAAGTGWAPYPVSLRIVNWIKWFTGGAAPEPAWLHSLAVQARWLTQRLEWHLLGNHLFANAKALVFAGLFFDGAEAQGWLARGQAILQRELPEQILSDGGHFERSPMYHALALEDLLDLLSALQAAGGPAPLRDALAQRCGPMLRWLLCMRHADGALAAFNDCAEGIAPPTAELQRLADALGVQAAAPAGDGVTALQPSGYLRLARGDALAFIDAAPVGPDYLPGHAHADTLSFELSLAGRRVLVNRGTSVYGNGPRRLLERGTAAHNTVQLGGHDSSEVWSGFRVGRRARPRDLQVQGFEVQAAHDGYAHLPGRPHHRRRWLLQTRQLVVEDRLPGADETAVARFHLAPGLRLAADGAGGWRVLDQSATFVARVAVEAGSSGVEQWQHAQRFGVLVPAETLAVRLGSDGTRTVWTWER
jgi:uncharacterized heparinase superfamily protein